MDSYSILVSNLTKTQKAFLWLKRSYQLCLPIDWSCISAEDYDRLSALSDRYGRALDALIHKLFRSLDAVELQTEGTLIDVLNRAHKRGLCPTVKSMRLLKELRNTIAHEYVDEERAELHLQTILDVIPDALAIFAATERYAQQLLAQQQQETAPSV